MAARDFFQHRPGQPIHDAAFTGLLLKNKIAISMDGRAVTPGQCLCRAAMAVGQIRGGLFAGVRTASPMLAPRSADALVFYNALRPHSSLDARTPDHAYFNHLPQPAAAHKHSAAMVGSLLRSGSVLPAHRPDHGLLRNQPAGDPLIDGETLSRPSRPPLSSRPLGPKERGKRRVGRFDRPVCRHIATKSTRILPGHHQRAKRQG